MYQKVRINGTKAYSSGVYLGIICHQGNGVFEIVTEGKGNLPNILLARYGTMNEGKFYAFCNSTICGTRCRLTTSPACRHNRNNSGEVGYYVDLT